MSNLNDELLMGLVIESVLDKKFRSSLNAAVSGISQSIEVKLNEHDIERLKKVLPDVERFANSKDLHRDDAKSWVIGVFEVRDLYLHFPRRKRTT
jgi:hypothetical protein